MTCANCGERIAFVEEAGGYWYHPETNSVWCYEHDPSQPPSSWDKQAEPQAVTTDHP